MENTDQSKVESLDEALQILDEDEEYFIENTKHMNPMELAGTGKIIKAEKLAEKYKTVKELEEIIDLVKKVGEETDKIYSKKASKLASKENELGDKENRWKEIWFKFPDRTKTHDEKVINLTEEIKTMKENLGENIYYNKIAGRLEPYYIAVNKKNKQQTGAKKKRKNKTKKKSKIRKSKKNKRSKKSKKK